MIEYKDTIISKGGEIVDKRDIILSIFLPINHTLTNRLIRERHFLFIFN